MPRHPISFLPGIGAWRKSVSDFWKRCELRKSDVLNRNENDKDELNTNR